MPDHDNAEYVRDANGPYRKFCTLLSGFAFVGRKGGSTEAGVVHGCHVRLRSLV